MSYRFTFADNEVYTATDVNAITKRLVTAGIEDAFLDGVAYNVSKFNEAGKVIYTSGAVPEDLMSLKVVRLSDTEILINPGVAFFDDGAVIEIEAGGEVLSYVSGSKNYVYLKNDLIEKNTCYPVCSVTEPSGDYVMLCEIDENGEIKDKRIYAKGKLPGYQSCAGNIMRLREYIEVKQNEGTAQMCSGTKQFDIGNNNFEYILTYVKLGNNAGNHTYPCLGIYDIANNTYLGFGCNIDETSDDGEIHYYYKADSANEESLYIHRYNGHHAEVKFTFNEGKLDVALQSHYTGYTVPKGYYVDLVLL
jgi:hypothetical protein